MEQRFGVGVTRTDEEIRRRPVLNDLTGVHHRHVIGDIGDHAEVVRDEDHRHVFLALQPVQQLDDLRLCRDIERRGGLVGDQELG